MDGRLEVLVEYSVSSYHTSRRSRLQIKETPLSFVYCIVADYSSLLSKQKNFAPMSWRLHHTIVAFLSIHVFIEMSSELSVEA